MLEAQEVQGLAAFAHLHGPGLGVLGLKAQFGEDRPQRHEANRPPGDAALTHAARLTGRDAGAVVVDLEDYAQIARVAR